MTDSLRIVPALLDASMKHLKYSSPSRTIREATEPWIPVPQGKSARAVRLDDTGRNPEIQIVGYGIMTKSRLEQSVKDALKNAAQMVGSMNPQRLYAMMTDVDGSRSSGLYPLFLLRALSEVDAFISSPAFEAARAEAEVNQV